MMTCSDNGGTTTVSQVRVSSSGGMQQRTLRSATSKSNDDETSFDMEEAALVQAEEKMIEDEEIESCDESGKPVVDTETIDRRNLTVALVNSVVETSNRGLEESGETASEEADKNPQHSYGLRRRSRDSPSPPTGGRPTRAPDARASVSSSAVARALPAPPVLPKRTVSRSRVPEGNSSQSAANAKQGPISDGLQQKSQVPNPLMHSKVIPPPARAGVKQILAPRSGPMRHCLLFRVPCRPLRSTKNVNRNQGKY